MVLRINPTSVCSSIVTFRLGPARWDAIASCGKKVKNRLTEGIRASKTETIGISPQSTTPFSIKSYCTLATVHCKWIGFKAKTRTFLLVLATSTKMIGSHNKEIFSSGILTESSHIVACFGITRQN